MMSFIRDFITAWRWVREARQYNNAVLGQFAEMWSYPSKRKDVVYISMEMKKGMADKLMPCLTQGESTCRIVTSIRDNTITFTIAPTRQGKGVEVDYDNTLYTVRESQRRTLQ